MRRPFSVHMYYRQYRSPQARGSMSVLSFEHSARSLWVWARSKGGSPDNLPILPILPLTPSCHFFMLGRIALNLPILASLTHPAYEGGRRCFVGRGFSQQFEEAARCTALF